MSDAPRHAFICIEGVDAVGKRTQSSLLNSWLISMGFVTKVLSFPDYETTIGREIRAFLTGERNYTPQVRALLYAANRWEKSSELIELLTKSDAVIVNRYSASNIAYGLSNGLELEWLLNLEEGLPEPDVILVLDSPVESLSTRRVHNKDAYERDSGLQERTRRHYLELAERFRWKVVDATGGIESTSRRVRAAITEVLPSKGRTV